MNESIAIDKKSALRMFYVVGYNTEELLLKANELLNTIYSPSEGYYIADDVSKLIESN